MLGLHKDIVRLVPYDPEWVEDYKKEEKILRELIGDYVLDIQHVGSTSIPGLSAKPILDVAVAVKDENTLQKLIPILTDAGYDVKDSISDLGEVLARKGLPENRTHYIHIEVAGSEFWNNHILFRDYLIKHSDYVREYERLKTEVFEQYKNERKKYTLAKNEFISKVIEMAKLENLDK